MTPQSLPPFDVSAAEAGHTLSKVLRSRLGGPSWAEVRKLVAARRVQVGDAVCADEARRLKEGEQVTFHAQPKPLPRTANPERLVLRHLDEHVVVVEKPSGINSVRHPAELEWAEERKTLDPTLQDLTFWAVARRLDRPAKSLPPLRIVHRLDKETSGLLVFARSALAERELGMQFRRHTVVRRYLALVPGYLAARTIRSTLVRDRGDGRRGSTPLADTGKEATTHVAVEERLQGYSLLSCRLETGAPTRSASTCRKPATRSAATRSTAARRTARFSRTRAGRRVWRYMPWSLGSSTPRRRCRFTGPCRCPRICRNWSSGCEKVEMRDTPPGIPTPSRLAGPITAARGLPSPSTSTRRPRGYAGPPARPPR